MLVLDHSKQRIRALFIIQRQSQSGKEIILDLIRALRDEKNVIASTAITCRGIGILESVRDAVKGKLPPSELVRLVTVIVPDSEAKDLFEFIYEKANIGREAGGGVWMGMPISATRYTLPSDVPDERMRTRHNEG